MILPPRVLHWTLVTLIYICCYWVTQLCPTLCDPVDCSTTGFPVLHHLLEHAQLMSIESVMPSNHLALYCPLFLLPSIFPSIRAFSSESVLHIRWPKYWSFTFSISLSNEYLGMISFGINWFDLAVQGTLKSLLQHYSSKTSSIIGARHFYGPTLTSVHELLEKP